MISKDNFLKNTLGILGTIFLLEAVSFLGYLNGLINVAAFFLLVVAFIFLCIYNFRAALLVALAELIIGSKGYLFYWDFGAGRLLSIRIAFWVFLMIFWFINFAQRFIKDRQAALTPFINFKSLKAYGILVVFVILGTVLALVHHNAFSNWFFDLNAWIYFLILLPWLDFLGRTADRKNFWQQVLAISVAAISWLALKSLAMLYIFTHFPIETVFSLYRWIRTTGVGEVTLMPNGFYRVFFQSQVYLVFAWPFALFAYFKTGNKKLKYWLAGALIVSGAVIFLSFSRSFWVGVAAGAVVAAIISFRHLKIKEWLKNWAKVFVCSVLAIALVLVIAKFPYPHPTKDFSASSLAARAELDTSEAATASRWSLLPALWKKIEVHPLIGSGYGTTVTYQASDPRVLEVNQSGTYTTYAFEWGWLGLWLKFGLLGVLAYIYLLVTVIRANFRLQSTIGNAFAVALIALMALHTFTPYLDHPLGIMFIVLASLWPILGEQNAKA